MQMAIHSISIIIPSWNSRLIDKIVEAIKAQLPTDIEAEILVIGSDIHGLVVEDGLVRFIANPDSIGGANDRNIGMREARGDALLFTDHDCLPAPDWIVRHIHCQRQGMLVVGGAVSFDTRFYLQLADNVSAYYDLLPFTAALPRLYLSTANMSVHRTVITHVGEMDTQFCRSEDLEWTARLRHLGYTLYFEPTALVFHDPPRFTFSSVWRHWTKDAPGTLSVRLRYQQLLRTPALAHYRWVFFWGAPFVAAWATIRTFSHPQTVASYWYTLPLVYITKIAWCWGAFKSYPDASRGESYV
ncbi:MAG: glycosyltransferase [Chloroflexota bacterium]